MYRLVTFLLLAVQLTSSLKSRREINEEMCHALPSSDRLILTCKLPNQTIIPCDKPIPSGAKAFFKCKEPYKQVFGYYNYYFGSKNYTVCEKGKWDSSMTYGMSAIEEQCKITCPPPSTSSKLNSFCLGFKKERVTCPVPLQSGNEVYFSCAPPNRQIKSGEIPHMKCGDDQKLKPAELPEDYCGLGTCQVPSSDRLVFTCKLPNQTIIPCDKPIPSEAKAFFKCKEPYKYYISAFYHYFHKKDYMACENGKWDSVMMFGISLVESQCEKVCPLSPTSPKLNSFCKDYKNESETCTEPLYNRRKVYFSCAPPYRQIKSGELPYIECDEDKWKPAELPEDFCGLDGCFVPPSVKLDFTCELQNRTKISCKKLLPNGAKIRFRCKDPPYKKVTPFPYSYITCKDGKWNKFLPEEICQTVCGLGMSQVMQPNIGHGTEVNYGEFPWHVALYQKIKDEWKYSCGGSVLSSKVVITAAHCIAEVNKGARERENLPPDSLLVAAGKYHRDVNETDEHEQIRTAEFVYTPEMYLGAARLYAYDIGFLVLKEPFELNAFIRPICVDIGWDNFEREQLFDESVGNVTGWGLQEDGELSDVLKVAPMPYVSSKNCVKGIDRNSLGHVFHDKFCAGNLSSETSVCKGDSGGGIVFYYPPNNRYYLRGIVSVGGKSCEGKEYTLFTKISSYPELVNHFLELEQIDGNDFHGLVYDRGG